MKKIYDKGKTLTGLIIFVVLVSSPTWYNLVFGKGNYVPDLKVEKNGKECVKRTSYMKKNHMELLKVWRDEVVRTGNRTYVREDGEKFEISLSGTCLKCHTNKQEFCDRCHRYVGVTPYCFGCHNIPRETRK
ncbi:MAG: sulfate reduction electron transfer complex DsrMKJOP subunit DsrJ [Deltaproteobacteria bacterium]|nr:sulfate reduction electron transfer complex DsrMKJOP subunit DsrJ [Deltaproteobacteria bacterium]